ncbi:MAG: ABC transporter substrate-binding protein [Chloroflexi bacterium]|nr:ABC transporter substrate-binding protein [Chloroflexota bacterium]MCI0580677.1 ABC transporter substrate-binding protein [Chloroflexota bacterium]MCI0644734.1 ABC transporter substrate-binding protein [Chloroflexota bacterium]MCI0728639.1 ABC transporter substrate-binding protein [Chloroflexota bacterium]
MNIRLMRFVPLAVLSVLWLAACTATPWPTPAAAAEPLRVSWNPWPGSYPLIIGHQRGLFEKHGVQVEPVFISTAYSASISDFTANKLDGASLALGDLLPIATRTDVKAVLVTDVSTGADQVLATADITTPADLRGKRVGAILGTFSEVFVRAMLEANSLTTGDVELVNVSEAALLEEMPDTIQAGHTWEPYTSEGLARGYHAIFSTADTPGLIAGVLAFHTSVIEERPEGIQAFVAAWFEAVEWWQAHPQEGNIIVAEAAGLKPEEITIEGLDLAGHEDNLRAFAPGSDYTSVYFSAQSYLEFFIGLGILTSAPDPEALFEPSFMMEYRRAR